MFVLLTSCLFFLLFISAFLLLLAVCLQSCIFSPPSAGISFSPDSSPFGTSPLSRARIALLFQETLPAPAGPLGPSSGRAFSVIALPAHSPAQSSLRLAAGGPREAGRFVQIHGQMAPRACSRACCSPLSTPHGSPSLGSVDQEESRSPAWGWGHEASCQASSRSSRVLQGGAAAGEDGSSQNRCRDGQGNEIVDLRQGERFQNRKGSVFVSAVVSTSVSSV